MSSVFAKLWPGVVLALLLASCGSVHKLITSSKKTSDSTAVTVRDSSGSSRTDTKKDNLSASDVDVTVYYGNTFLGDSIGHAHEISFSDTSAESALAKAKKQPARPANKADEFAEIIQDAVSNSGQTGHIVAVSIHIGSISDSSSRVTTKDSGAVKTTAASQVKTTDSEKSKTVQRTSPVWIIYLAIGIAILLVVLFILKKLKII